MTDATTIWQLLAAGEDSAPAISAPGRPALTYGGLRRHVEATVARLNQLGIGRNDPLAIVLSNGPEMASAFVSIGAGATTAPLNPAYQAKEFEFYLNDLGAKALLVEHGSSSAAIQVAHASGIPLLELTTDPNEPAGLFDIHPAQEATSTPVSPHGGLAHAEDVALVLHTSGTTSRPKMVPLSQANLCASAANIRRTLVLTPEDRCLNIMPLFHIHGLMAAVLASLQRGSQRFLLTGL